MPSSVPFARSSGTFGCKFRRSFPSDVGEGKGDEKFSSASSWKCYDIVAQMKAIDDALKGITSNGTLKRLAQIGEFAGKLAIFVTAAVWLSQSHDRNLAAINADWQVVLLAGNQTAS